MKKLSYSLALVTLTGCSAASGPAQPGSSPESTAPVASPAATHAASPDDNAAIQRFLDARYKPSDVRHSFRSNGGQDIDCIDFAAQPGVKALDTKGHPVVRPLVEPTIPAHLQARLGTTVDAPRAHDIRVAFAGDADDAGNARACPEGTVPQVRISADQVRRAGGIAEFRRRAHAKVAPPRRLKAPPPDELVGYCGGGDTAGYAHVIAEPDVPAGATIEAGSTTMAIYEPTIPLFDPTDYSTISHSISQTWMDGVTDSGLLQTVEVGWNVDETLYEDDPAGQTHLFIFATADGYQLSGCYNDWDWTAQCSEQDDAGNCIAGSCVPWVQVSKQYAPGMTLPVSTVGKVDPRNPSSLPKELSLSTVQIEGNWWILLQVSGELPTLLGYYSASQITATMTNFEVGGEVYSGAQFVNAAMGSGQPAAAGPGFAAYHRNYFALAPGLLEDAGSPFVHDSLVCTTEPAAYTYSETPKPIFEEGPSLDYFYYGGDPTSPVVPPSN